MIKPIINAEETIGKIIILVGQRPYYQYKEDNGNRVKTDTIVGYMYECVALEKQFERFNVKIEGDTPLFKESNMIPQNCQVEFEKLSGNAYVAGDKYKYVACSFNAENIFKIEND